VNATAAPMDAGSSVNAEPPFVVFVPVRTVGQNGREHYAVKAKRIRAERDIVRKVLDARSLECPWRPPLTVTLTRYSSGHMDSDGHIGALKSVRDEVAAWLRVDDRFDSLVEYVYRQSNAARGYFGVRIEIKRRRVA
jgi:hypothetical protein